MKIRDRVIPVGQTLRVHVLPSAIKNAGKPRVYGYVWGTAQDENQDLLTCWTFDHGWLLSKVFHDDQPGFGPGMTALLDTLRTTDVHAVVVPIRDRYAQAIARRIERSGTSCLVVPG
ncbi:hypothetical protein [Kibdelosporangium phytohabitans]|uniref:Resolvase/invertase-type recombinase catalytic domain-containing protein n=1 Tax=Kibdelosporangium phytohabitans TaxID=860235 RepID=A0A0N9HYB0_9PSEU|nr:hypothetical protein [Kibdelosporangium phytohabitans]ALG07253.1 hypothetical protein AOZ06_10265 [Kibdelosporangium phytohabitans]MBE1471888.1 hypothetical protein [Kibdelosporangium phytohabitans]